ncbi:UDP-N-acetylglucosamine 1-carboxyvinyltransferase [Enterobacteriaceae endosymbiont of Donacia bicoloricornis]|uniref:UDP-N-acetylglucosamine 1-carboxyvinyltransferase n=1 Tax=Enterobacteriaceae endosymbiont of Donacia bicoloricornis TaxID=2675772 RepID=UPI0014490327|nr:UDP-N-acetylglucosamine 1-carboxyvinyltransferase [Enterobacteriaceae endosymbiont of Donacia bicoloricornis]QJC37935.1 UDP-N-acetylglucosamine 1-carboxyvinyltransferase [Enterobacteriaceae endosymbiont of Donacia bicoloricornis]
MSKFIIKGPVKLNGEVNISGSKNAALPILFASLLIKEVIEIKNIPKIKDIDVVIKLFIHLGVKIKNDKSLIINASNLYKKFNFPKNLIKSIRASIWLVSPLLVRLKKINMSLPGGCSIGMRPIDLHIKYLQKLGANICIKNNYIIASIDNKFIGSHILMKKNSVGATISVILASIYAKNTTIIDNAAQEPEIEDLINFLNIMGANIKGGGTKKIIIKGVLKLKGGIYRIMDDRIEAGTFLIAAAISKGYILCKNTNPKNLKIVLKKLKYTGAEIKIGKNWCSINMHNKRPKAVNIITGPYPKFPTDMQPQFTLLNCISLGSSIVEETIFENRFLYIHELNKMGAKIFINKNKVFCQGVSTLYSTQKIKATDLRASISLVLAACIAIGITIIDNIDYIDRGYENIEKKLISLGAKIKRLK